MLSHFTDAKMRYKEIKSLGKGLRKFWSQDLNLVLLIIMLCFTLQHQI